MLFTSYVDADPDTCSLQQQKAVQMVLSLYGVLLKPVEDILDVLDSILCGDIPLSSKVVFFPYLFYQFQIVLLFF